MARRHDRNAIIADILGITRIARHLPVAQPNVVELHSGAVAAIDTERVDVAVAPPRPVDELDAELERRLRFADEFVFIDSEQAIEVEQRRYGRLANADGADLFRFNQGDRHSSGNQLRKRRSRHPPRSAAADDDDAGDRSALATHAATPWGPNAWPCAYSTS